jgi:hypothetical protein
MAMPDGSNRMEKMSQDFRPVIKEMLAEKDAEIERLEAENARLKKWNLMTDEQVVMDLKAEIERMKKIIGETLYE